MQIEPIWISSFRAFRKAEMLRIPGLVVLIGVKALVSLAYLQC